MRDYWVYGLLAATTIIALYWTLAQMGQRQPMVIIPVSDDDPPNPEAGSKSVSAESTVPSVKKVILGSDQPVDEDPDFDIELEDLGAIASFETQRM